MAFSCRDCVAVKDMVDVRVSDLIQFPVGGKKSLTETLQLVRLDSHEGFKRLSVEYENKSQRL